jgi:hypothetical protein
MNYLRFKLAQIKAFKTTEFAVIEVEALDESINTSDEVMDRIANAIADWVENTKEGKEMWEENDGEITMRDIADVSDLLNVQLTKEGLKNLRVCFDHEFETDPTRFTLDSNLPVKAPKGFNDPSDILG